MGTRTHIGSATKKALAAVTAAGLLTLGTSAVAFGAEGSTGSGDPAAASAQHPKARRGVIKTAFSAAAAALGMSNEELRAAVLDGPRSIAEVAGDQNGAVVDAVTAALEDALDQAVADGRITEERAEHARTRIPMFVDRFVNRVPLPRAA